MNSKERILWITRTAVFIALLITLQTVTKPLGQYVTGSLVNMVLILSVMLGGTWSGITVALLSNVFAFMLGIGPAIPVLVPFVALGNLSLVLVWNLVAGREGASNSAASYSLAVVAGAVTKFLVLYLGIVRLAVPVLLGLPEPQATVISTTFSFPQLITAFLGGAVATAILPLLKKAIRRPAF